MIRVTREEGHYTIKRVDELPTRGNANWLYMLKTDPVVNLYRWHIEGGYEEINIGLGSDISPQNLQEVSDVGNITITQIKPQGGILVDDITVMPEVIYRVIFNDKVFESQEQILGFQQNGSNVKGASGVAQNIGTELSSGDWTQWRDSQTNRYPYSLMLLRGGTTGHYRTALTSLLKDEGASQISSRLQIGYEQEFPNKLNQFTLSVNGTGEFLDNITSNPAPTIGDHLTNKTYVDGAISSIDLTGYVTINTAQTITGQKTFTQPIIVELGLVSESNADIPISPQGTGDIYANASLYIVGKSNNAWVRNVNGNVVAGWGAIADEYEFASRNIVSDVATSLVTIGGNVSSNPVPTIGDHLTNKTYVDSVTILKKIKVTLSASEIKTLQSTNIELLPAPGVGKMIVLHSFLTKLNWGSVAFDENSTWIEWTGGSTLATGNVLLGSTADIIERFSVDTISNWEINTGLSFAADADSGATGDSTLDIYLTYEELTL